MNAFYVNIVKTNYPENPGIDGSYIELCCKDIPFELKEGDAVKVSKNSHILIVDKIENVSPDGIFSHWKLKTKILTNNKKDCFEPSEVKSGQFFYKINNPFE